MSSAALSKYPSKPPQTKSSTNHHHQSTASTSSAAVQRHHTSATHPSSSQAIRAPVRTSSVTASSIKVARNPSGGKVRPDRCLGGNEVGGPTSDGADGGRSKSGRATRKAVKAEVHDTVNFVVAIDGSRSVQSPLPLSASGVIDERAISESQSCAMLADVYSSVGRNQGLQQMHSPVLGAPGFGGLGSSHQTTKKAEEMEKMRILAHHIKIYTDWANHYLEKVESKCFITDLQSDMSTGVVLADLVFAVVNESVPNIYRSPYNSSQMIHNIENCLDFLVQRGASVDGIEAKNIRAGSLKSILGLLFNLSNYKHHLYQQSIQQQQSGVQQQQRSPSGKQTFAAGVQQTSSPVLDPGRRQLPPLPTVSSGTFVEGSPRRGSDGSDRNALQSRISVESNSKVSLKNQGKQSEQLASSAELIQPRGANSNQYTPTPAASANDKRKKQATKSSSAEADNSVGRQSKTLPAEDSVDARSNANTSSVKSSSMLTKFRLFKDRGSTDAKTRCKDETAARVPLSTAAAAVPEPDTGESGRDRVSSPGGGSSGQQQRRGQLPQPSSRSSATKREQVPAVKHDVAHNGSTSSYGGNTGVSPGQHLQYAQVPVISAHQYYGAGQPGVYYGQGAYPASSNGYQAAGSAVPPGQLVPQSPQSPQRMPAGNGLGSPHQHQSRLPSSSRDQNGHAMQLSTNVDGSSSTSIRNAAVSSIQTDATAHQQFGASGLLAPQPPTRLQSGSSSSRRGSEQSVSASRDPQQSERRRHGEEPVPIRTSSMPSRTASSTSISSIASASTACGGSASGVPRRSGLARRVSSASSSNQQDSSMISGKRSTKSAAVAASSSSRGGRTGKTSSSSASGSTSSASAATLSHVTSRPPHVVSSESSGTGSGGRQSTKNKYAKDDDQRPNSDPVGVAKVSSSSASSKLSVSGSRIGLPGSGQVVGRSDSCRSFSARGIPNGSQTKNLTRSTEAASENSAPVARSSSAAASGDRSLADSTSTKTASDEIGNGLSSTGNRGPPSQLSRLPSKLSQPRSTKSAAEQLRRDDFEKHPGGGVTGTGRTAPTPISSNETPLSRPLRDKSSSSVSSGFGDESNHSTSDSTDSVIYQPPCSPGQHHLHPLPSPRTAANSDQRRLPAADSKGDAETSSTSPRTSTALQVPTSAIDHIASLRTANRPAGDRPPSGEMISGKQSSAEPSKKADISIENLQSTSGDKANESRQPTTSKTDQTENAFDVEPMQPIVRSSVGMSVVPSSCTVYQPPTARRLPTLLAAQGSSSVPGPSASRRLTFGRPLIGPSSRYPPINAGSSSRIGGSSSMAAVNSSSSVASGYTSDGDILHRSTAASGIVPSWRRDGVVSKLRQQPNQQQVPAGFGNGYQSDRLSGYMSEGGGASATYARRMQQRFLEGIMAVRQSMERSAHFVDDDSFDECSSMSSDDLANIDDGIHDELQIDAILENASSDDGSNGQSSPPTADVIDSVSQPPGVGPATCSQSTAITASKPPIQHHFQQQQPHQTTTGSSVRTPGGEVDRILGNGWRKYYIDSPSGIVMPSNGSDSSGQRRSSGLASPFERGSNQRITLPLAVSAVNPGGLLVKRSQQSVVTDLRSRDGGDVKKTEGAAKSTHQRNGADNGGGQQRQQPSRPPSSLDEQRGERLSNYSRSGGASFMHRQVQGETTSNAPGDGTGDGEWSHAPDSSENSAGDQFFDDFEEPNGVDHGSGSGARRSSGMSSSGAGSVVHKDGGQGPAPQPLGSVTGGFHDYVNINYVGTSRSLGRSGSNRINQNGLTNGHQQWIRGDGSGLGQRFPGGRMAMSETESIENIAAAAAAGWPPMTRSSVGGAEAAGGRGGSDFVQRSDSFRSASDNDSSVQVWRNDPGAAAAAAAAAVTLRLQAAGYGYGTPGGTPGRTSSSSVYSTPVLSGGKSRLSASKDDSLHHSTLSLGSNSSAYSTAEEQQAQEIRRLRHELEAAQTKISTLSTQLCTNAHVVSAFEQSLANMTHRLQHLAANTDQKEAELSDLRKIIDVLRHQGNIQFNLTSYRPPLVTSNSVKDSNGSNCGGSSPGSDGHVIRRHVSSDSVTSMGSCGTQQSSATDASAEKKKKQKTWLKIPFGKAFSRTKKTKPTGSTSDADSDTTSLYSDTSLAHSAHAQLLGGGASMSVPSTPIKLSRSDALCLTGSASAPDQSVHELQQQLHEKDMKLTDIRLEALSSAHQLEQLRDTMNRMKNEMMSLKQDNERLQYMVEQKGINVMETQHNRHSGSSHHSNTDNRLSLDDPTNLDLLLADSGSRESHQKITLSIRLTATCSDSKQQLTVELSSVLMVEVLIGIISITGRTTWNQLADIVRKGFKDYLVRLDPGTSLGLSGGSIGCLHIGDVSYSQDASVPELLPCGYLVGDNTNVSVSLKGAAEKSVDSLAFETMIPKTIIQRYVSLLVEHRRIILCGPSGTGKTFLAQRLAEYLVLRAGESLGPKAISTFSVDHKSGRELRQYLSSIADQCEQRSPELPVVIILDSLHHVTSLSEVFNGFLSVDYQTSPYIIGTMNQTTSTCSPTNLQLHHNFRWVLCANHVEPVLGFLARYLRRRLVDADVRRNQGNSGRHGDDESSDSMERVVDWIPRVWQHLNKFLETHSSTDVTVGPRLFLSCPMDAGSVQGWFNDLWNYSIVPYLLEAIKEGVQSYGSRVPWEDPSDWVVKTYPWSSPSTSADSSSDWPPLLRLRPEDVGHDSTQSASSSSASKMAPQPAPSDTEANDPLLNMLMRLQEAASYTNNTGSTSGSETGMESKELSAMAGVQ